MRERQNTMKRINRSSGGALLGVMFFLAMWAEPCAATFPRIVNGVTSHGFPTTGALLHSFAGDASAAAMICSGTLIGCRTFLTASHCVEDDSNPSHYFIFLQHAGVFAVTSVTQHPSYTTSSFPIYDVAVLKLASDVTGISPTAINQTDPTTFIPASGTVAGFGQTGGSAGDFGIKRAGAVTTADCQPSSGGTNAELVCWDYTAPIGPPGTDSNTCNGDSGGPLFMDLGAGEVVAGVTSGGIAGSCGPGDHSYDANVYAWRSFILGELGGDSVTACGAVPPVGDSRTSVVGYDGFLDAAAASALHSLTVTANANLLRVTLNGEDNGSLDADLYVRAGVPPTTTTYDCKADGSGEYGGCEFALPAAGTWYFLVNRSAGSGDYQVTATVFGGDPPVCGNNLAEIGEDCDGTDDAQCAGLCRPDCTCPPPVCGNNVVESGEQCDGSNDGACPGACLPPGDPRQCLCNSCGNGVCDGSETADSCPVDCGCGAPSACAMGQAPSGCYCDPQCVQFGDCCPDACTACAGICSPGCGNAVREVGEECDDGNTQTGDCCSPSCSFDTAGTACDDGSACTASETCDGAGQCQGTPTVVTGCLDPGRAVVQLQDRSGDGKDRFKWKWKKGGTFTQQDLGQPSTTTGYEVCVFDRTAGSPSLALHLVVPPGPDWTDRAPKGWRYKDKTGFEDGVRKLVARPTAAGRSFVEVLARSPGLLLPGAVGGGMYFAADPVVTVQVINDNGTCWTSDFSQPRRNLPDRFFAKTP